MSETAWLVERHEGNLYLWVQISNGGFYLTNDSRQALRLSRKEDAVKLADIYGGVAIEHSWMVE